MRARARACTSATQHTQLVASTSVPVPPAFGPNLLDPFIEFTPAPIFTSPVQTHACVCAQAGSAWNLVSPSSMLFWPPR